jgi:PadR family transcriptional regulator, regulatory protein PadR
MISNNELLVLAALAKNREAYGRALIEVIASLPNGRLLSLGSLYPTLARLERKGLVCGRWADDTETREGARRRYFSLTAQGLRTITETYESLTAALSGSSVGPLPTET